MIPGSVQTWSVNPPTIVEDSPHARFATSSITHTPIRTHTAPTTRSVAVCVRRRASALICPPTHEQTLHTASTHSAVASEPIAGLLVRMRCGDRAALATVYSSWFDRAFVMAKRLTKYDESFCLDVVQDSMLALAKNPPKVVNEAQFAAWLGRVVCRKALDRIKADRRRAHREARSHELRHHAGSDSLDCVASLQRSMRLLKDEDKLALVLRFDKDMTLQATADGLGITRGAAHGKIRRAIASVGAHMKDELNESVD